MEKNNCEKKLIKLYSSINFSNPVDKKEFCNTECNKCKRLKTLIHFIGEYNVSDKPKIYFRAKVLLSSNIIPDGNSQKYNITVNDICFKNEFNVSASSLTNEYQYLYDISCSSADNNIDSNTDASSCSTDLSLSEIINNGIEKQITNNVRNFIESDAFVINWVNNQASYILDTTKYDDGKIFPNVKMIIKYKPFDCSASSYCSSSSSSSSSSSCSSSNKSKKFIKLLIMGFVCIFIIMILFKFIPSINIFKYLSFNSLVKKYIQNENKEQNENKNENPN